MPILGNLIWNAIEGHFQILEVPRREDKYTCRPEKRKPAGLSMMLLAAEERLPGKGGTSTC